MLTYSVLHGGLIHLFQQSGQEGHMQLHEADTHHRIAIWGSSQRAVTSCSGRVRSNPAERRDAHLVDGDLFVLSGGHLVDCRTPARLLQALGASVIDIGARSGAAESDAH